MKSVGKTIVLIMLILILIFGSLLWFQYLGLMPVKSFMNPVFKLFHLEPQTSVTQTSSSPVTGDLYEDRLTGSSIISTNQLRRSFVGLFHLYY